MMKPLKCEWRTLSVVLSCLELGQRKTTQKEMCIKVVLLPCTSLSGCDSGVMLLSVGVRACARAWVCICACVRVCVSVRLSVGGCLCAFVFTHMHVLMCVFCKKRDCHWPKTATVSRVV